MSKTLSKAMRLVETLATSSSALSVGEVSRTLKLNKATVHRHLRGLVQLGYVRQVSKGGAYEPTIKLWELGMQVIARRSIGQIANSIMRELAEQTGETVHLAIPDKDDAVYIHKVDGQHPLRIFTPIGGRVPLYCGSTGKAILAFMPDADIDRVASNLKPFTPRTITSKSDLHRELAIVRRRGYSFNVGEWRVGISGVAAPIRDRTGAAVASIGLSGPSDRLTLSALRAASSIVTDAALRISAEMGFIDATMGSFSACAEPAVGRRRR